jgi:hypothetical protein
VLSYRVTLDVPFPLVLFVSKLLLQHRREIGTRKNTRALSCWQQAIFVLAWFRDRPGPAATRAARPASGGPPVSSPTELPQVQSRLLTGIGIAYRISQIYVFAI